jgi:hypothetical protein
MDVYDTAFFLEESAKLPAFLFTNYQLGYLHGKSKRTPSKQVMFDAMKRLASFRKDTRQAQWLMGYIDGLRTEPDKFVEKKIYQIIMANRGKYKVKHS